MARGTWSETNMPKAPGFYNRMKQIAQETSNNIQGVLALPVKSNWGPVKTVTSIKNLKQLKSTFGDSMNFTAYKLGRLALLGSPKEIMLYRLVDSSAATWKLSLQNSESIPANVITLETLYPSDRVFKISVQSNIVNASNKDIILYEETKQLAKCENISGSLEDIVTLINKSAIGEYVVAKLVSGATGTLANISTAAFTGGNNGTTNITNAEYTDAMTTFKSYNIDAFALDGVKDPALITTVHEWAKECAIEGLDVLVFASTGETTLTAANTKSKEYNSTLMHNGYATTLTYDGVAYTIEEVMVYIAALAVGKNLKESICNEVTIFEDVQPRLNKSEIESALEAGTIVFTISNGKVVIVDDVNTYKNYDNEEEEVLGNIRAIRFINTVNKSTSLKGEEEYTGKISNDDTGHTIILCGMKTFFDEWKKLGIISGYNAVTDDELMKDAKVNQYFWKWDANYVDVAKQIFGTGNLIG